MQTSASMETQHPRQFLYEKKSYLFFLFFFFQDGTTISLNKSWKTMKDILCTYTQPVMALQYISTILSQTDVQLQYHRFTQSHNV